MIRNFNQARKLRPFKTCATMLDLRGREIRLCPRTEPAEGVHFEMGETAHIKSNAFRGGFTTKEVI